MRFIVLIATIVALAAAAPVAKPKDPSGARAFIERVYADYPRRSPRSDAEYYGMFAPELSKLIRQNDHYAEGEVGPLDGDPICQCQDDAGFRHRIVSVAAAGGNATVVVRNSFAEDRRVDMVTYRLLRVSGHWKIADIGTKDQPSLKHWLRTELAKPH